MPPFVQPAPPGHINRGFQPRTPVERGEDVDDDEIERITTKYARVLNPRPISGIDTGAEEEVLDPEIHIPQLKDFIPLQSLDKVVDLSKTAYKFLPKQGEIDRLLKRIEKKVLRDINISNELRDLKAAYMESPHFRDIYLNLMSGKVPFNKEATRRMENSVRDYLTLDRLLFKIVPWGKDDYETVLCIPTSKAHILMDMYHSSLCRSYSRSRSSSPPLRNPPSPQVSSPQGSSLPPYTSSVTKWSPPSGQGVPPIVRSKLRNLPSILVADNPQWKI